MAKNRQQTAGKTIHGTIKLIQTGQRNHIQVKTTFPRTKKVFFNMLLVLLCFSGFSQSPAYFDFELFEKNVMSEKARKMGSGLTFDDISGSPYSSDEFIGGEVFQTDSNVYRGVLLRFNIYADKMEFKNKGGEILEILEPGRYNRFVLGNQTFRYITYTEGNRTGNGYLQILAEGSVTVYKKLKINFQEEQKPKAYQDAQPPQFNPMPPEYYLSVNGGQAESVKSQKQALELLNAQNPGLAAFVKKEKLNLNKEEELIKAVEYCNNLSDN